MITVTFYAPTNIGRRIQDNVKRFDGRFVGNPFEMFNGQSQYAISFEDGDNYRKFSACTEIVQQPWF